MEISLLRPTIVQLPAAPQVTARTRFDSAIPKKLRFLMPGEALARLKGELSVNRADVVMVAINGPGDPLAVPDTTLEMVSLIRQAAPGAKIGLRTLGIGGERFACKLANAGVDFVEIIVNGIRPEVLRKLYAWIRPGLKTLKIDDGVALLLREQRHGVPALKYAGIAVGVSTILYPGYNHGEIERVGERMMELGADGMSVMPYQPEADAEVTLERPDSTMIGEARRRARRFLQECLYIGPADATTPEIEDLGRRAAVDSGGRKTKVAVASSNGMEVDLHLGKADSILVYGRRHDGLVCLLETRKTPPPGGGSERWRQLATLLEDCFAVLARSAGPSPKQILAEQGLRLIETEDSIEGCVDQLYGGGRKSAGRKNLSPE